MATPAASREAEAIARLEFMVGRWRGSGWHAAEDGSRAGLVQTETVRRHAGGRLLTVEGLGHAAGDPGRVVHEAFALVWFDAAEERYWWEAFARGGRTVTPLEVEDRGFRWTLDLGEGRAVRFTARFADGRWEEAGEASTPGAGWRKTFEMTLERAG